MPRPPLLFSEEIGRCELPKLGDHLCRGCCTGEQPLLDEVAFDCRQHLVLAYDDVRGS